MNKPHLSFTGSRACVCAVAIALALMAPFVSGSLQGPLPARVVDRAPKLIVLVSVDQFRGDYIDKFRQQWTRGLHRIVTQGAWFRRASYPYFNTVTCAGHASISTGTVPAVHGFVLNSWWDREARKVVNCTDDDSATTISYGKPVEAEGESLVRLRTTTLADELRTQLSPAARVIAFSLKARSAVTLSGLRPYAVAWFDDSGTWVTSSAFAKAPIPEVAAFVKRTPVEGDFGKVWDRALPKAAYLYEDPAIAVRLAARQMSDGFPHVLKGGSSAPDAVFYTQWQTSPYADEYLARLTLDVAARIKIGKTAGTDLVAISFSALDKVGHDYGPNSHEVQDVLVRLDRTLGVLLAGLDRLVGPENYTLAMSADHGVAPMPERSKAQGFDAGRTLPATLVDRVEQTLAKVLGPGKYVDHFAHTDLYLAPGVYDKLRAQPSAAEAVRAAIRALPGIREVYMRDEIAANQFAEETMGRRLARSYYPGRSGDLMIEVRPYWIIQADGTTHGTGYAYDAHVPVLMMGKGIVRGEYLAPASPTDLAPTLAFLAGVTLPDASGRVLAEALSHQSPPKAAPTVSPVQRKSAR